MLADACLIASCVASLSGVVTRNPEGAPFVNGSTDAANAKRLYAYEGITVRLAPSLSSVEVSVAFKDVAPLYPSRITHEVWRHGPPGIAKDFHVLLGRGKHQGRSAHTFVRLLAEVYGDVAQTERVLAAMLTKKVENLAEQLSRSKGDPSGNFSRHDVLTIRCEK